MLRFTTTVAVIYTAGILGCILYLCHTPTAEMHYNKAYALLLKKKYTAAIESFDRVLKINPSSFVTLYNKGIALAALHEYEQALGHFELALEAKPDDTWAIFQLGRMRYKLGQVQKAIDTFQRIKPGQEMYLEAQQSLADLSKGVTQTKQGARDKDLLE